MFVMRFAESERLRRSGDNAAAGAAGEVVREMRSLVSLVEGFFDDFRAETVPEDRPEEEEELTCSLALNAATSRLS